MPRARRGSLSAAAPTPAGDSHAKPSTFGTWPRCAPTRGARRCLSAFRRCATIALPHMLAPVPGVQDRRLVPDRRQPGHRANNRSTQHVVQRILNSQIAQQNRSASDGSATWSLAVAADDSFSLSGGSSRSSAAGHITAQSIPSANSASLHSAVHALQSGASLESVGPRYGGWLRGSLCPSCSRTRPSRRQKCSPPAPVRSVLPKRSLCRLPAQSARTWRSCSP